MKGTLQIQGFGSNGEDVTREEEKNDPKKTHPVRKLDAQGPLR
jgi:hypothetical protein